MSDDTRIGFDWARIVENLQRTGLSVAEVCELAKVPRGTMYGYLGYSGARSYPEHSTGERLLALWMERTGLRREDAPKWHKPLSVSEVLKSSA